MNYLRDMMVGHFMFLRVIISLDREQPVWFGRKQDSNGAKVTTYLDHENIIFYPEELIQAPPTHPMILYLLIYMKINGLQKT